MKECQSASDGDEKCALMTNVKKTKSVSASETKVGFLCGINDCSIQQFTINIKTVGTDD